MAQPKIELQNLSKSFGRQLVLDGISLSIPVGEAVVIIGQSGTGKSVLLKHVVRLLDPDSGQVLFDGEDISNFKWSELVAMRRRFGMLFQGSALFDSLTVGENVGLGLKESLRLKSAKVKSLVREKLELVGLSGTEDKWPSELSGGMRKRVGLARAIAADPEVLLYDEPTTGLDPVTSDVINELIVELNSKLHVTSIAVTHDMQSALKIAVRIIMLYQGKIQFDGTPDELKTANDPVVCQFLAGSSKGPIQVR